MWKPSSIFIGALLIVDSFFVSYAVALNSRSVDAAAVSTRPASTTTSSSTTTIARATTQPSRQTTNITSASTPARSTSTSFTDLTDADSRLQSTLSQASKAGVFDVTDDKRFRPNDPVTRADFTRWMVRIRQVQPIIAATPTYSDVDSANKYYADIEGATRANMVQGYTVKGSSQKQFKPEQHITRQEFAVMYGTFSGKRSRAEKLKDADVDKYLRYNPSTSEYSTVTYKDVGDVDDWARKWVAVAHQAGVLEQAFACNPYSTKDDDKYLRPQRKMKRGEAANILWKLYGGESEAPAKEQNAAQPQAPANNESTGQAPSPGK
ncbi:MAG TPA: S-layer homology domain-containing protein [Candidatus Obscuribacterales bacterium]